MIDWVTRSVSSYSQIMSQPKPDFSQLSIAERIVLVEDIWDCIVAESPAAVTLSER